MIFCETEWDAVVLRNKRSGTKTNTSAAKGALLAMMPASKSVSAMCVCSTEQKRQHRY